ncbi:hypothetical protein [Cytobacillus oceanisediminis]|uniref:Uncharacterized protein n=1 Tax=Cytobacillus oceanisediminis 2691 TaxID=1196031 RepID=A0A160MA13_9BACI|nr:hypothetical protein [Cytobacillus oceanisediminis]AND39552.1 hypothetical protein A361_10545 [Cytobacillus oceanisediminis 2691]
MSQISYPFDNTTGVGEAEWTEMAQHFVDTGIMPKMLKELKVFADSSGMQVKVNSGVAFIKGNYYKSDAEEVLPIGASDGSNPRIDRVVIRVDWIENETRLHILQGSPAVTPVAPGLTQNTGRWEISLAQIRVDAGVLTIAADKVTDERYMVEKFENRLVGSAVITSPGVRSVQFGNLPDYINEYRLIGSFRNSAAVPADLRLFLNTSSSVNMAGQRQDQYNETITGAGNVAANAASLPATSYACYIDASIVYDKRSLVPFIHATILDGYNRTWKYTGRGTNSLKHLESLRILLFDQDFPTGSWFNLYRV